MKRTIPYRTRKTVIAVFIGVLALNVGVLALKSAAAEARPDAVLYDAVDRLLPSNTANVITRSVPRPVALVDLGLELLQPGPVPVKADEIRVYRDMSSLDSAPLYRIWRNSREGNRWWYIWGAKGSAEKHVFQPGQVVIVLTRASTNEIPWKNPLAADQRDFSPTAPDE